jgi:hypothetical protein
MIAGFIVTAVFVIRSGRVMGAYLLSSMASFSLCPKSDGFQLVLAEVLVHGNPACTEVHE